MLFSGRSILVSECFVSGWQRGVKYSALEDISQAFLYSARSERVSPSDLNLSVLCSVNSPQGVISFELIGRRAG